MISQIQIKIKINNLFNKNMNIENIENNRWLETIISNRSNKMKNN
jgi:hypothetical protein